MYLDLRRVLVRRIGRENPEYVCHAARHQQLHVPGRVREEVVLGQVDGQRHVDLVGLLVLGLAHGLEVVRHRLQPSDQLVGADVVGDLGM